VDVGRLSSENRLHTAVVALAARVQNMTDSQDAPTDALNKARAELDARGVEYNELARQANATKSAQQDELNKVSAAKTELAEAQANYRKAHRRYIEAKAKHTDAKNTAATFVSSPLKAELNAAKAQLAQLEVIRPQKDQERRRTEKALQEVKVDFPERARSASYTQLATVQAELRTWFNQYRRLKKRVADLQHQYHSQENTLENNVASASRESQDADGQATAFKAAIKLVHNKLRTAKSELHATRLKHREAAEKAAAALAAAKTAYAAVKKAFEERNRWYAAALAKAQSIEERHVATLARRKETHSKLVQTVQTLKTKLKNLTDQLEKEDRTHSSLLNAAKQQEIAIQRARENSITANANLAKSRADLSAWAASDDAAQPTLLS